VSDVERCLDSGGVVVFPTDTVYGLGCAPESEAAVERLYALKGRPPDKPAAVMFFALDAALSALPELGARTGVALRRILPGALTVLLPNPARHFPLACGPEPETIGLRVPAGAGLGRPVLQSSANRSGGPDARRLEDVPETIRRGADLVLDGGELPGIPSTVVDLRAYERGGGWAIIRAGAVSPERLEALLGSNR
jgi:L-threonylcarbamoyladenylate synthase